MTERPADNAGLSQMLRARLAAHGQATCITFLHRSGGMQATPYSGQHLLRSAEQRLNQWRAQFGSGSLTLALALPAGPEFVISMIAGLLGGITIVALPPAKPNDPRLPHILRDSCAQAVMCLPSGVAVLERALLQSPTDRLPCPIHDIDGTVLRPAVIPTALPSSAAVLQYTSGSTRMPKGVLISPQNIVANCDLVTRVWQMGSQTTVVNWLPHYHDMGLMGCILYPILFGGTSVQMNPLDVMRNPANWLRAISEHGGTISGGPAFAFVECLNRMSDDDCTGLDLSSWKQAFCGSEPIKPGLFEQFQDKFAPHGLPSQAIYACYGMAETTLFVAGAQHGTKEGPLQTQCHLCDNTRNSIAIIDPETLAPCPPATVGEIWVRGDSVALGYHNLPDETRDSFVLRDGIQWLRTGDLGSIKHDDLFITGRRKDMLIVHGRNIAATEAEWLVAEQHAALNPLAAAAFASEIDASDRVVVLIELKSGHKSLPDADGLATTVARALRGNLGLHLLELRILPRGTLDRTSSGKVRRAVVAASYGDGKIPMGLLPKLPL